MTTMQRLNDWDALKEHFRARGSHYFSPDTMRFFRSRLIDSPRQSNDGRMVFFVTSEKRCFDDPTRTYNLRSYNVDTGHVETIGDFCTVTSRNVALRAMRRALEAYEG